MRLPALLVAGHHDRGHERPVGIELLDLGHLLEVHLERPVGDELDVVEAHQAPVGAVDGAVARARHVDDGRPVLAERLPHDAAPAGLEGAQHVGLAVGRGRRGEPERVRRADAEEVRRQIGHHAAPASAGAARPRTKRSMECAACLPSSTALTVRSCPPAMQSPPAQTSGSVVRRSASTRSRPAVERQRPLPERRVEEGLADGGQHEVGRDRNLFGAPMPPGPRCSKRTAVTRPSCPSKPIGLVQ